MTGECLGNDPRALTHVYPQALTHVALISATVNLDRAMGGTSG
jgi:hypothetical protein